MSILLSFFIFALVCFVVFLAVRVLWFWRILQQSLDGVNSATSGGRDFIGEEGFAVAMSGRAVSSPLNDFSDYSFPELVRSVDLKSSHVVFAGNVNFDFAGAAVYDENILQPRRRRSDSNLEDDWVTDNYVDYCGSKHLRLKGGRAGQGSMEAAYAN